MYTTILVLHSWLRWLALAAGVLATIAAAREPSTTPGRPARSLPDRLGLIFMMTLDIQLLLGLSMYLVLSPTMASIRENFGASMRDPAARFWAVEHISMMLGSVILVHAGRVLARKSADPNGARLKLFVCFGVATVLMFLAVPWPGMRAGRPLLRGF